MPARSACPICPRADRAKVESEARAARGDLGAFVDVCARYDVTRARLEKHLDHADAPSSTKRRKRGKAASGDDGPPSGRRSVAGAQGDVSAADAGVVSPLPPPRELDSPDEELRRRARLLTQHLERTDLEPRQLAQVSNALGMVDRLLVARAKIQRPIHEHPDFELVYGTRDDAGVEAFASCVRRLLGRPATPEELDAYEAERDTITKRLREGRLAMKEAA